MFLRTLAALWLMLAAACCTATAAPLTLTQAWSITSDASRFPTDLGAQPVELPDDWSRSRPRHEGGVWYRARFDRPTDGSNELQALFVERVCGQLEVVLNGTLVHSANATGEPSYRQCLRPQLVVLPRALLLEHNTLDLRVQAMGLQRVAIADRAGGLSALQIGALRELAPLQAQGEFWNVHAVEILSAVLVLLGLFMLNLYRMNRGEVYLLYFGALSIGWALLSARVWWLPEAVEPAVLEFVLASACAPVLAFAVQFLLSYAGLRSRIIEGGLALQCLLMPLSLALAGAQRFFLVASAWQGVLTFELCACIVLYLSYVWRHRKSDFWPMWIILSGVTIVMLGHLAVQYQVTELNPPPVAHLVMPLLLVAVGARLMQLFARALQAAEASRASLESRVREATAEVERNFEQLAEARVEAVTEKERKRIAADLHDDLGAKLLTIVHTSESERIATLAREALEEMRLSVRGLTGRPVRLIDALADWRNEVVLRLGQANIEADWRAPHDEMEQLLNARAYVQTTRIFREAVSNIIKHSGASLCQVSSTVGERDFMVTIQDNGKGIPMELDGKLDRGHGMSSMKHRAKQLQGQCLVESGPGYGTVIRLTLPL